MSPTRMVFSSRTAATCRISRIEALAARGYRKIAALMRHAVTNSSVARALRQRGLRLPQGLRADSRARRRR